jgi:hypothetical protein
MGQSMFGIFDVFKDEAGQQAQLNGGSCGLDGECRNVAGESSGD